MIFDPPHLDKCDRNNSLTKHLELVYREAEKNKEIPRKCVQWKHYEKAFDMDVESNTTYRSLPKLTEFHVRIGRIRKIKNIVCRQVLSRSMVRFIERAVALKGEFRVYWKKRKNTFPLEILLYMFEFV